MVCREAPSSGWSNWRGSPMVRRTPFHQVQTIHSTSSCPLRPPKLSHFGTDIQFRIAATCRKPLFKRSLGALEAFMSAAVADLPNTMTTLPETIECPLCVGKGTLTRTEVLERLGTKDLARVAQPVSYTHLRAHE